MAFIRYQRQTLPPLAVLALALALLLHDRGAHAHEGIRAADEPPTRFEQFLLSGCVPCVTESHVVATLATGAAKMTGLPRSGGAQPGRAGEIRIEAVRAYQLGRPSRQSLALRVTLSVAVGAGELYRVAVGLVDEGEAPTLSAAITDIARLATAAPLDKAMETADASVRGGSLRIGLLRLRGESAAYAQAGDPAVLALRAVWDVPTTMYMPPEQLPALAKAIGEASAKIRQLRNS